MEESVSLELTIVHKVVINPAKKTDTKLPAINEYTTRGAAAIAANGQPTRTPNAATATVASCLSPKSTSAAASVIAYIAKELGKRPESYGGCQNVTPLANVTEP